MSAQLEKEKALTKIAAAAVVAVASKRAAEAEEAPATKPAPAAPVAPVAPVAAVAPEATAPAAPKEASLSAKVIAGHLRTRMDGHAKAAQVAKVKEVLQKLSPGATA